MGFGDLRSVVLNLLSQIPDVYFVVVCGNNKKLEEDLKTINNPNLIVRGFIKNMNEYIKSSKIVVTKPGGLTTTEVAVMNKPLIHINPIPGVEDYNASFFASNNMSLRVNNVSDLANAVGRLLLDVNLRNEIIQNQSRYINKNSATDLVRYVMENYGSEEL